MVTRLAETWEECHSVLCELEGVRAGTRAFGAARAAAQTGPDGQPRQGKGLGKKGKDGDRSSRQPDGGTGRAPVCFEMRDNGTCSRGNNCRFSHDPRDTGRPAAGAASPKKRSRKRKKKAGGQVPEEPPPQTEDAGGVKGPGRGKRKGKGKGKEGKGKGKGKEQEGPPSKKRIL